MATYTVTIRIDVEDPDNTPDWIREEIYDACQDAPFGMDITNIREET